MIGLINAWEFEALCSKSRELGLAPTWIIGIKLQLCLRLFIGELTKLCVSGFICLIDLEMCFKFIDLVAFVCCVVL